MIENVLNRYGKPWQELTKEDIGLRPLRDDEKTTTEVLDFRGLPIKGKTGPERARKCNQSIQAGRGSYQCNEDAKWTRDDTGGRQPFYCGRHAAGELRSRKNMAKIDEEIVASMERSNDVEERAKELSERLGIEVLPSSEGYMKIATDDLEALANEREER